MGFPQFAASGVSDNRNLVAHIITAAPAAVEGVYLLGRMVTQPTQMRKSLTALWNKAVLSCFSSRSSVERCKQIVKAGVIAGAAALPYLTPVPPSFALPVSMTAVYATGALIFKGARWKKQLVETFTSKPDESDEIARKRICKNTTLTLLVVAILAGIAGGAAAILPRAIQNSTPYSLPLPYQTPPVVFAEYALIGVLHEVLAIRAACKMNRISTVYHALIGAESVAFALWYLLDTRQDDRLHHSIYGLASQLLPFRSAKVFGNFVTADSWLYAEAPLRGGDFTDDYSYTDDYEGHGYEFVHYEQYDLINVIADNLQSVVLSYVLCGLFQLLMQNFVDLAPQTTRQTAAPHFETDSLEVVVPADSASSFETETSDSSFSPSSEEPTGRAKEDGLSSGSTQFSSSSTD